MNIIRKTNDINPGYRTSKTMLRSAGLLLFSLILLLPVGCSKRIALSSSGLKLSSEYDSAAFDYVFTEAIKQKFLGNAGDALKYLEQCLKINPKSDAAYYEMAQIALMISDPSNGKKFALKAATLNDRNFWYLNLVANVYYQEKNLDSAILYYEKIVKNFPEKEDIKLNLANVYSESGH